MSRMAICQTAACSHPDGTKGFYKNTVGMKLKNSQMEIVPHSSHFLLMENPDYFANVFIQMLLEKNKTDKENAITFCDDDIVCKSKL